MKNLPAKSTSRGIQKAHRRKYSTGKVTVVNPGNKKKTTLRQEPRNLLRQKDRRPIQTTPATNKKLSISFKPKQRGITNPQDLWDRLMEIPDFAYATDWINNNKEMAKDVAFQEFKNQLENTGNIREAINATAEELMDSNIWDDWWGGSDSFRITKFGNWQNNKSIDNIINDDATWRGISDPFEGELFKKNTGWTIDWDKDKWHKIDMEGVDLAEMIRYQPQKGEERDHKIMKTLDKAGVPFLHVMHGQGYRVAEPDWLMIPAQYKERAETLLKGLK